jgi:hypothetical protein
MFFFQNFQIPKAHQPNGKKTKQQKKNNLELLFFANRVSQAGWHTGLFDAPRELSGELESMKSCFPKSSPFGRAMHRTVQWVAPDRPVLCR